jgi:uncharacterized protein (DUF2236 family)
MLDRIQDLMRPPDGMAFDFSQPAGEPALTPADGVSWQVFANPVSLFVGGVTMAASGAIRSRACAAPASRP